jgi:hypothetical protein
MDNTLSLLIGGVALGFIAFVLAIISFVRQFKTEKRLRAFMAGKDGEDLEKVLIEQRGDMKKMTANLDELLKASEYLHRALQNSLRKVAFERYNPFPGVGGNQSFTLVMLDAFNSGVVISSMHNRDSNRVYAKSIKNGSPIQNLSEEEQRVLKNAIMMKGA